MNCTDARDALLVADPLDLRDGASSALAVHLAACVACRAIADGLSRDLGVLSAEVVRSARRGRRRRRLAVAVGLPIAASLVAAVAIGTRRSSARSDWRADVASRAISVDVAHGQQAAVFNTTDPNVTVVWLSPGGDP